MAGYALRSKMSVAGIICPTVRYMYKLRTIRRKNKRRTVMQKIISLFQRNYETDRLVRDEVVPGAEWVLNGEGTATRKWDGMCCMVRNGQLFKRYEVKRGKAFPPDFEPACDIDPNTGKQQGWRPVGDGPEDRWFREAFTGEEPDGTYELIGQKVQGNPEGFNSHTLVPHGQHPVAAPRTFDKLREWFKGPGSDIEGVVWWHDDGRKVKIKAKDFGIRRVANQR
jgi:hypothetical protein